MGFVSPFVLPEKMLLQELRRKNLGWDDRIDVEHLRRCKTWQDELPRLEELNVRRCFKPKDFGQVVSIGSQLHHFSDASQGGYGAVSYLRLTNQENDVHRSFVNSKSRLASLKKTKISRLELPAAVVATRLDIMIRKEIDIPIDASLFWIDSTCVIGYMSNVDKRFQTFVANRVAKIREVRPSHCRHIPTRLNPADHASRRLSADELINNQRWLSGPNFLWKPETHWPTSSKEPIKS